MFVVDVLATAALLLLSLLLLLGHAPRGGTRGGRKLPSIIYNCTVVGRRGRRGGVGVAPEWVYVLHVKQFIGCVFPEGPIEEWGGGDGEYNDVLLHSIAVRPFTPRLRGGWGTKSEWLPIANHARGGLGGEGGGSLHAATGCNIWTEGWLSYHR